MFQRNRPQTVGEDAHTRYQLLEGGQNDRRTEGLKGRRTDCQILCPLAFRRKRGSKNGKNIGILGK